jgi:acetylglutamate kinase
MHVILDRDLLNNYAENCMLLSRLGASIVIVHDIIYQRDLPSEDCIINMVNPLNADLTSTVLCGYVNKKIVEALNTMDVTAVSISGKDSNMFAVDEKRVSHKSNPSTGVIDIDISSKPEITSMNLVSIMEDIAVVPVISPVAYDRRNCSVILDPCHTAAQVAIHLNASYLIFPHSDAPLQSKGEIGLFVSDDSMCDMYKHMLSAAYLVAQHESSNIRFVCANSNDAILKAILDPDHNVTTLDEEVLKRDIITLSFL